MCKAPGVRMVRNIVRGLIRTLRRRVRKRWGAEEDRLQRGWRDVKTISLSNERLHSCVSRSLATHSSLNGFCDARRFTRPAAPQRSFSLPGMLRGADAPGAADCLHAGQTNGAGSMSGRRLNNTRYSAICISGTKYSVLQRTVSNSFICLSNALTFDMRVTRSRLPENKAARLFSSHAREVSAKGVTACRKTRDRGSTEARARYRVADAASRSADRDRSCDRARCRSDRRAPRSDSALAAPRRAHRSVSYCAASNGSRSLPSSSMPIEKSLQRSRPKKARHARVPRALVARHVLLERAVAMNHEMRRHPHAAQMRS